MNDAVVESDDIDLGALIRTLVEHWASLVGGVLIGVFSGLAVWQMSPFVAEFEVRPLSLENQATFVPLNNSLREFVRADAVRMRATPQMVADATAAFETQQAVTAENLIKEYVNLLGNANEFIRAVRPVIEPTLPPEEKVDRVLRNTFKSVSLMPANFDAKRQTGSKFDRIKVTTKDPDFALSVIGPWIKHTNHLTKTGLTASWSRKIQAYETWQAQNAEDLSRQAAYAIEDYRKRAAARVALLSEEASIARKLGLKKATIESTVFEGKNSLVANVKTDSPLYLRGYEALEKEISLITSRKTVRDFVSGLIEVEAKLRAAKDDPTARRLRELIRTSPLTDPQFQVVTIDVAPDAFARSKGWPVPGALGAMAGGFVAMLYVFARVTYRRRVVQPGN